jgi:DNA-binding GntR family transcriptional regulator
VSVDQAPLGHPNLGDRVYRVVREKILAQTFAPGTRIRVDDFTRDLGVSRTPVLDALRRLAAEGLVSTVPRHGIYVVEFTRRRAEELYAVRGALEALAGRLAASRVAAGQIEADRLERLRGLLHEQTEAVRAQEFSRFSRADIAFHSEVLAASGNETLTASLEVVYGQILVLRLRTLTVVERAAPSLVEHERILAAIEAGDPSAAETAAREHVGLVGADTARLLAALDG